MGGRCARGSSPHARGAPADESPIAIASGIIPACAGSTLAGRFVPLCWWDHPRMRGEHATCTATPLISTGSSPHARGALNSNRSARVCAGIIPACAGSTTESRSRGRGLRDHPRMRGEHFCISMRIYSLVGSSPHARGARPIECGTCGAHGIIPACAGSTRSRSCATTACGDHPRMRGEHWRQFRACQAAQGSSPHARGAPPKSKAWTD